MNQLDLIKKRKSIRSFTTDEVTEYDIQTLLEAARWAPSAGNRQPLEIVIIRSTDQKERLAKAALGQKPILQAPVVFVVCADVERTSSRYGERGETVFVIQDTAAATQNILLTAASLDYGTVWIGAFDEEAVSSVLKLPTNVRPFAIIPIGRPQKIPDPRPRREIDDFIHQEVY